MLYSTSIYVLAESRREITSVLAPCIIKISFRLASLSVGSIVMTGVGELPWQSHVYHRYMLRPHWRFVPAGRVFQSAGLRGDQFSVNEVSELGDQLLPRP